MWYATALSFFTSKTNIIRIVLIGIILSFMTYFYLDYTSMKEEIINYKSTEKVLVQEYNILQSEKEGQDQYYKSKINTLKSSQKIIYKYIVKDNKRKENILKDINKDKSFHNLFKTLKKEEV